MPGRQEIRSEETRRAILKAAGELFAQRGFDAVTMREIARAAGCSHTTIYIYFKDKEALLHQLSMEPLQMLQTTMEVVLEDPALSPDERLKRVCLVFIRFCLASRNMYAIFFMTKATRVDEEDPALEINRLRNHLFGLLRRAVWEAVQLPPSDERVLAYARILFYNLHGIIGTYTQSEEPLEDVMGRLAPTFELAIEVMLVGMKQHVSVGGNLS
ncbi:MAG: TetR/AcrR family transcriptional regulator [Bacillota bacterium]